MLCVAQFLSANFKALRNRNSFSPRCHQRFLSLRMPPRTPRRSPSVAAACSSGDRAFPSRARCCPALNVCLLAAYSTSALAARSLSSAGFDLPALPDDSESCIGSVEHELRNRGVALLCLNASCAGCSWPTPRRDGGSLLGTCTIQRDCAGRGFARCTLCLRTLNQVSDSRLLADATACSHWPSNSLFCDHLLPSLGTTLRSLRALSLDPSLPGGKLRLQSDLDIAASALTVHLHNFHLLLRSGLFCHDTSPSAPDRRGSTR